MFKFFNACIYCHPICSNLFLFHRGATQKKIEDDTGVKIIFPSSRREDSIGLFPLAGHFKFSTLYVNLAICIWYKVILLKLIGIHCISDTSLHIPEVLYLQSCFSHF